MRIVRWLRGLVIASLLVKIAVWGTWWTATVFAEATASGAAPAESPVSAPNAGLPASLLEQSRGFREVLDAVAARQDTLAAKEKALAEREAGLAHLEKAVAQQVAKLEALAGMPTPALPRGGGVPAGGVAKPGAAAGAGAASAEDGSGRGAEVTRIYESMKAEEAAPILDKLDDETLRAILGRMKERQIGAILAAMNRDRAVAFTKLLAGTRQSEPAGGQVSPTR